MADVNEVNDERQALEEKRMEELSAALEVMEALTKVWGGVGKCGLEGYVVAGSGRSAWKSRWQPR